ncbi:MAG: ABC transporter ATP-binding protein [Candidatus Tectomicrobia bacterium]|uniref:ABC transporter ATP-binding protein n=1 Tax=Tectimicrobiota bacterium TaxID=2528274 RepID=A0A933LQ29_UNCTE|nr:ABC transporter ATP-binding protein [Candidatus Tectomicrobia bacterium]
MLKLSQVDFFYGKVQVLKNVSFEADRGIVTLVGPNGAGKSTLLKLISGLLRATSGAIHFEGQDLNKLKPHQIVKMGVVQVPERRRIFPQLTVRENLELGAYVRKERGEIEKDMDYVYQLIPLLKERETQLGGTLSGGEQQLLALARGYMSKARLMLIDEPTLGLAPKMVDLIINLVKTLNQNGIQILLIEEDLEVVIKIATSLHLLRDGEIVLSGDTEEIKTEIRKYLEKFV